MLSILPPALALALLLGAFDAATAQYPQGAPGAPGAREELFVLELPAPTSARSQGPPPMLPVGVATLRQRRSADVEQSEWELHFFEEGTRVQHVERWSAEGPRLVWREWRPGGGRTLLLGPRRAGSGFELVEWGRQQRLRTDLEAPDGLLLPNYLLEQARSGELRPASYPLFDPLSRTVERVTVEVDFEASAGERVDRVWRLRRDDQTSAGSFRFRGDELVEFRWQGGALMARAISPVEYRERLEQATAAPRGAPVSR